MHWNKFEVKILFFFSFWGGFFPRYPEQFFLTQTLLLGYEGNFLGDPTLEKLLLPERPSLRATSLRRRGKRKKIYESVN